MRIFMGGLALLLAVVAVGCGSGGDTTGVALTKAQFIKRGDAICQAAKDRRDQAVQAWLKEHPGEQTEGASVEELGRLYLAIALPPIKEASDDLAELSLPAGDQKAEKFVELFTAAITTIEEKPTLMFEHKPYRGADLLARAYGFEVCGYF